MAQGYRYPHVIDDPAAPEYQPNTHWDVGKTPPPVTVSATPPKPLRAAAISGTWNVAGAPAGCTVRLSLETLLDLHRASSSGCGEAPIAKLTGWRAKGRIVELFMSGDKGTLKLNVGDDGSLQSADGAGKLHLTRSP